MEMQGRREGIVGLFSNYNGAEQAIYELRNMGIPDDDLSLAVPPGERAAEVRDTGVQRIGAEGGLSGLLSRIGLGGGDIEGTLRNMGFSEDLTHRYADRVKAGSILLIARCDAGLCERLAPVFARYGATDVQTGYTAASQGREPAAYGTGYAAGIDETAYTGREREMAGREGERTSMPIREERPIVGKERVQSGEVEISKEVVEEERTIRVPVSHEEVTVTRHEVGERPADTEPRAGETLRVPISEEKVNITKEPVVTGEVEIQKEEVTEEREVRGKLRREVPHVDKEGRVIKEEDIERDKGKAA